MQRVLVVLPFYGGSLPVGRYCAEALRETGCLVDIFDAPAFYGAFQAIKALKVRPERQEFLENSFLQQIVAQAVLAKVEAFVPDLVLCLAQAPMSRQVLKRLRADGIPTAMWFVEDFQVFSYWRAFAAHYDVFAVIQKEPFFTELASINVTNVLYLPLAALPSAHKKLELSPVERKKFGSDLSFMGAGYPNRRAAFRAFAHRDFKIWGTEWDGEPLLAPLVQMQGARISSEDAVRIFNASRVNLNLHSSVHSEPVAGNGDFVNPRTFEIAAAGAFQLVDKRSLMPELFAADELATFATVEEMHEKIAYFLARPEEREAYALRGQQRVLAEHTYARRMETLLAFVRERFPTKLAAAKEPEWLAALPEEFVVEARELVSLLQLPLTAAFSDVTAALRLRSGELSPLETAILFLDEWKKQYCP